MKWTHKLLRFALRDEKISPFAHLTFAQLIWGRLWAFNISIHFVFFTLHLIMNLFFWAAKLPRLNCVFIFYADNTAWERCILLLIQTRTCAHPATIGGYDALSHHNYSDKGINFFLSERQKPQCLGIKKRKEGLSQVLQKNKEGLLYLSDWSDLESLIESWWLEWRYTATIRDKYTK